MSFCFTHRTFYSYGNCPDCLRVRVAALPVAAHGQLVTRFNELLADPDEINQDQFGVCGTTTAVHLLLRHKRAMAANLFEATFAGLVAGYRGRRFATAAHGNQAIDFTYLSRRFALLLNNIAVTNIPAGLLRAEPLGVVREEFFVDFCMSRALGYVFKQLQATRYQREKVDFNAAFDPYGGRDYRRFTRAEGFALRTQNLAYIMRDLLGAQNLAISRSTAVPGVMADAQALIAPTPVANELQFRNFFNLHHVNPRRFALAAVFGNIVSDAGAGGETPHVPFARLPGLDFNHWVLINTYARTAAGAHAHCPHAHVTMNLWTWGGTHNVTMCQDNVPLYVHDVIFGNL